MDFDELMSDSVVSSLTWYRDSDTDEIVAECNRCGAELRFFSSLGRER